MSQLACVLYHDGFYWSAIEKQCHWMVYPKQMCRSSPYAIIIFAAAQVSNIHQTTSSVIYTYHVTYPQLIIGTGCWVQVLAWSTIVGLSAGIQSAGDSVPMNFVQILHSAEEDNVFLSIWKSLACARASQLTTTNMYIARARCESLNGSGVEWAKCSLIIGTGCWVQVFKLDPR